MILYSIRRKSDGKFFNHMWGDRTQVQWAKSPTFWKTSESIWKHLKRLSCDLRVESKFQPAYDPKYSYWHRIKHWDNFDVEKLKAFDVIETNVNVLGEKQISAEQFVNIPQLEDIVL